MDDGRRRSNAPSSIINNQSSIVNWKGSVMADNVIELSDASFDETIQSSQTPVLVDFWAPWCGPCRMLAPIVEQVADEFAGKAKVCKLNTDQSRDTAVELGISAIPTVMLFKEGKLQKKWVGLTSKKDISEAITKLL
jgi:thioredoxin 1